MQNGNLPKVRCETVQEIDALSDAIIRWVTLDESQRIAKKSQTNGSRI